MGRIVSDGTYHYSYDSLGQLTTVKNNAGATVESYVYDGAGNILSAVKNGTTHTYSYGDSNWRDLLTSYDGQSITYDTIGNPLNYLGNTLTWQNGRQLETFTNGTTAISYSYDVNGMRTEKAVIQSGETTNYQYFYNGSTLLQERIGNNTILNFIYTADGKPYALEYSSNNGSSYTTYYYLTNLQGDVISILNSSGTAVVSYGYDSWGKITATTGTLAATLGKDNPLRYRGYVYDEETDLYYLQSRYYDPQVGRFINSDADKYILLAIIDYHEANLFAYCANNPIVSQDPQGTFFFTALGAVIGAITGVITAYVEGNDDVVTAARNGAITGAISGAGVDLGVMVAAATGPVGGVVVAGIFGAASGAIGAGFSTDWSAEPGTYIACGIVGAGLNMVSIGLGPISGEITKGTVKEMGNQLMTYGLFNLTENIVSGGLLSAGGAVLIEQYIFYDNLIKQSKNRNVTVTRIGG